jgi:hypothetical protein
VHHVQIDVQQVGFAGGGVHDVAIPHFFGKRFRFQASLTF